MTYWTSFAWHVRATELTCIKSANANFNVVFLHGLCPKLTVAAIKTGCSTFALGVAKVSRFRGD
jgi:hypothetical protein